jgi:hypothetical protein
MRPRAEPGRIRSDAGPPSSASVRRRIAALDFGAGMADDDRIITPVQLQPTQLDVDKQLLRDEDLLNEEHLRRMDQVLLRRNLDHARMFSRKLSLELQQFVHLYTPEANELRRRIEKYMIMERMIEREMARRHTY